VALDSGEHIVAVDVGGTNIVAAVLDHDMNIVSRRKKKSRAQPGSDPTEVRLTEAIAEALEEAGLKKPKGIGIGSPGPLDPVEGVIVDTPNLAWKDFPLVEYLEKKFDVPVVLDNDVNLGTYGEYRFGKASKFSNVLGVFPGTGVGGGWVLDGKLFTGASGSALEVGHITVLPGGPFCGCGKRGCLEAIASRTAIAAEIAVLAARHDAPFIFENYGTDIANIRSGAIAKAIKNGDHMVEAVVRRAAYYVGMTIGNLINVLSPEAVVIGGGLVEAMEKLYLEEVESAIEEHALEFMREGVELFPAKLGDDAVVMGAAALIADKLNGL
jgi:glucokinase